MCTCTHGIKTISKRCLYEGSHSTMDPLHIYFAIARYAHSNPLRCSARGYEVSTKQDSHQLIISLVLRGGAAGFAVGANLLGRRFFCWWCWEDVGRGRPLFGLRGKPRVFHPVPPGPGAPSLRSVAPAPSLPPPPGAGFPPRLAALRLVPRSQAATPATRGRGFRTRPAH